MIYSSDAEDSRIVQKKEREKKLVHTTSCNENGLVFHDLIHAMKLLENMYLISFQNGHNPGEEIDINLVIPH